MKFKNLYLRDNFLFIFSLFPIFILKSNFSLEEYFLALSIFFLLFLVNFFLINYFKNKKLYILNIIYLSFIITYGIDNLVGLHNALIAENLDFLKRIFFIIYIHSVILFFIIFILIFFSFKKFDNKKLKIIYIVFILSLFSFNLIDDTKSYKKINMYDKNSDQIFNNKTVILILDEMSGLNSLSSSTKSGKIFNNYAENFFKEHNFTYYTNSFSISQNSGSSISSLLNFGDYTEKHLRDKVLKKSANYFYEYDLVENKLFKNFKSISIFQNIHINYCKNKNINKCYTYNPFELDKLKVEVDFFSKYISLWHLNGSIVSKILWKLTKMFGLITSIVEPDGQKVFIKEIFNMLNSDVSSNKFDLIFYHVLFPHRPYGLNKSCEYNVKLSNYNNFYDDKAHFDQHNIERTCTIKFLNNFISKINNIEKVKILILSDHGARIDKSKLSGNSNILAYKDFESDNSKRINKEVILQEVFANILN